MFDPKNMNSSEEEKKSLTFNPTEENTPTTSEPVFIQKEELNEAMPEEDEAKENNDIMEEGVDETAFVEAENTSREADVTEEEPSVREYHYEEQVKKTPKKKKSWSKFVAACLIVSVAGGASAGAGYGAITHFLQDEPEVSRLPVSVQKVSSVSEAMSAADIIKEVRPSVVSISTKIMTTAEYFGSFTIPYEGNGMGSGVIFYSDDSRIAIATNNHVVDGATSIFVTLEGDVSVPAKVVGTKAESDLAVLTVSWKDLKEAEVKNVKVATFGDSESLDVGDYVFAIGNAMGMGVSATDGIISMTEQMISVDGNELSVLQTSAAINGGNSGGALVNSAGEVIGINTAKYNSSMAEGMGYAIPSNTISPIVEELLENGTQPKPFIGIKGTSITADNANLYKLPVGALIMEVTEGGAADKAGMQVGDIVTEFNGKTVMDMDVLSELVGTTKVGDTVSLHVIRNGETGLDLKLKIEDKNG